jgi:hypothetical protein
VRALAQACHRGRQARGGRAGRRRRGGTLGLAAIHSEGCPAELAELSVGLAGSSAARADPGRKVGRGLRLRTPKVDDGNRSDRSDQNGRAGHGQGRRVSRRPRGRDDDGGNGWPNRGSYGIAAGHTEARAGVVGSVATTASNRGRRAVRAIERRDPVAFRHEDLRARQGGRLGQRRGRIRKGRVGRRWRRIGSHPDGRSRRSDTRSQPLPTFLAEDELGWIVASAGAADHAA